MFWLGGAGLALATCFGLIVYSDAPEPDVSDLMPRPVVLSDEENLYPHLVAKGAALLAKPLIEEDAVDETVPRPAAEGEEAADPDAGGGLFGGGNSQSNWQPPKLGERLASGEGWTAERLALYGPALDAVAADARELAARYPQAQGTILTKANETLGPHKELYAFAQHMSLAAWAKYRAGAEAEALELALDGLRIGRILRESRGMMLDYLSGIRFENAHMEVMAAWVNERAVSPGILRRMAEGLDEMSGKSVDPDAYREALRAEFHWGCALLRDEVTAAMVGEGGSGMGNMVKWIGKTRVLFPFIYKRNVTLGLFAQGMREELVWTEMTVAEEKAKRTRSGGCPHCEALADDAWLRPANLLGRYMVTVLEPVGSRVRQTGARTDSRRSALRTAVALRLYSLDHDGALPETLAGLVPRYLPAVPRDFADDGEIRYSREARALWSVGVNNFQVTSPEPAPKEEREGMVLRLKFGAPEDEAR